MPGLTPSFSMRDVDARVDRFEKRQTRKMFEVLSYIGIESVKYAKKYHGYEDQTKNLTSSIGYAVIVDGKIEKSITMAEEGASLVDELARRYSEGMVLVVVAGMEYAAAVESKGYDVISGSSYEAQDLMSFMRERLGIKFL